MDDDVGSRCADNTKAFESVVRAFESVVRAFESVVRAFESVVRAYRFHRFSIETLP